MKNLHLPLLVFMILAGCVFADDEKTPGKVDAETQKLRNEFGLPRLIFLKQAVKDADVSDSTREALIKICDDSREEIIAAVDQEKSQPSEAEDRKQTIADLSQKFTDNSYDAMKGDSKAEHGISDQIARLGYELELIRKAQLVEKMADLDLTEEQKSSIEALVADVKKKVKAKSSSDVMKDEQAVTTLLDARKKAHEKLTDEQKDQWKAYVSSHANAKRAPGAFKEAP